MIRGLMMASKSQGAVTAKKIGNPHQRLEKVIGMTRVIPKTHIANFTSIDRIFFKGRELPICDPLTDYSNQPESGYDHHSTNKSFPYFPAIG